MPDNVLLACRPKWAAGQRELGASSYLSKALGRARGDFVIPLHCGTQGWWPRSTLVWYAIAPAGRTVRAWSEK